jgi:negative regulator of flagellin synthesis FlgM
MKERGHFMRINDLNFGLNAYKSQINRTVNSSDNKKLPKDQVEISAKGQELSQAMMSDQTDRQKRIEQIKQQIAEGTYQVDSQKVAAKMFSFWKRDSK